MNIEFKEGAVCFAFNHQWKIGDETVGGSGGFIGVDLDSLKSMIGKPDFQLNTIKQCDCIASSELDTEQKYNDVVEVFGLFGFEFEFNGGAVGEYNNLINADSLACYYDGLWQVSGDRYIKRKLTYNQLMAIGELKRMMIERDLVAANKAHSVDFNHSESPKSSKKPKSKEAYRILESMGIEWDEAERKWFKINKQWL